MLIIESKQERLSIAEGRVLKGDLVTKREHAMKAAKVLVVDDLEQNRQLVGRLIRKMGHETADASSGEEALETLQTADFDLVLLDLVMSGLDGLETLVRMKSSARLATIPVVMISGVDEVKSVTSCLEQGADDYIVKPFNPTILAARISSSLAKKRLFDQEKNQRAEVELYSEELEKRVQEQVKEISSSQLALIFALSRLAESRDPETGEHLERMRDYGKVIAGCLGTFPKYESIIDESYIGTLYAASPLHDIGKVAIPDRILQKPGKLTAEEFEIMKEHCVRGADTLESVRRQFPGSELVTMGIEIALSHHEKWDGSGYPFGQAGENIPLSGRILALGDVYDALTSKRCYKDAFSHEKSRAIILEGRGAHFDPTVIDAFLEVEEEFLIIRERHQDSEKVLLS